MWKDFISLLFPDVCIACNEVLNSGEQHLCSGCLLTLPLAGEYSSDPSANRLWGKVPVKLCLSYLKFQKESRVQNILFAIKYKGRKDSAEFLGQVYGKRLTVLRKEFDMLVPVPLHRKKLKKRGYNQSEWIAKGIGKSLELEVSNVLLRNKFTGSQTVKSRLKRWLNVEHTYEVADKEKVKGKKILLVDDVITTGATLEACANALLESGAGEVGVVTLAVAI